MNGNFPIPSDVLVDIDGNHYRSVQIGNQVWMKENLRVSRFRNGDAITQITSNQIWTTTEEGAYCYLSNDSSINAETFGALYNWHAVDDSRHIAPEGWHIPSNNDWQILLDYLGGEESAGGAMKSPGSEYWANPNVGATNSSGFTALPVGSRNYSSGNFEDQQTRAYFWSSTEEDLNNAWYLLLFDYTPLAIQNSFYKLNGYSVRCVKD